MATQSQIVANRLNAQKSTGPKTAEGKAVVSKNAVKHGLFAAENVIFSEKQSDYDNFREELLAGLAPDGSVESMMAERIVSLAWRLRRVVRMNSEAIDVMMARAETGYRQRNQREETVKAQDPRAGGMELILGWATVFDFSESKVLERLLMYEKRIESSLYKAMNELHKLQHMREKEGADAAHAERVIPALEEAATDRGRDTCDTAMAKPSCGGQDALATVAATHSEGERIECEKQSQFVGLTETRAMRLKR